MAEGEQIGWGILGTGGIAQCFTDDLIRDGHRVAAVGSRSEATAVDFAARFGIAAAYGSYRQLVEDPDVDVVYVSTPHTFHAENALLALGAGKHVLVEKPFTINQREAAQVVEAADRRGLLVMEAMWTRFLPHVARIREILAAGTIGRVVAFLSDHTQLLSTDPSHRINDPALGGGALLDLGIYPISFAAHLFGTPREISARASFLPTGADARVATTLEYGDGQFATAFCALDARGTNDATIIGTDGRIELDPVWYSPTGFRVYDRDGKVVEEYDGSVSGRGMQFEAREVEELIRAGRTASSVIPPEESVSIMGTLDRIRDQIGLRYPGE